MYAESTYVEKESEVDRMNNGLNLNWPSCFLNVHTEHFNEHPDWEYCTGVLGFSYNCFWGTGYVLISFKCPAWIKIKDGF